MGLIDKIKRAIGLDGSWFFRMTDSDGYSFDKASIAKALQGYQNPFFFTVIDDLAERMVSLPKGIYSGTDEVSNLALEALEDEPNDHEDWESFAYKFFANILIGEVYVVADQLPDLDTVYSSLIIPISSNVEANYIGKRVDSYNISYRGDSKTYPKSQVLHIKTPSLSNDIDFDKGFGTMQAASKLYDISDNVLSTQAGAFKGVGANKLISAKGDMPMLESEKKLAQEAYDNQTVGATKLGKSIWMSSPVEIQDIAFKPKEYVFPEQQEMAIQAACMMFRVAPQLYGSQASSTYNNVHEMKEERLLLIISKANKGYKQLCRWLDKKGKYQLNGASWKIDKSQIPTLNKPNLDYMGISKEIIESYNNGNMGKAQAFIFLMQLDYSEEEVNEMLSDGTRTEEV